jgi:Family of unknown function (DUF6011)
MSIKCGKCSGRHETVAEVKRCYAGMPIELGPDPREAVVVSKVRMCDFGEPHAWASVSACPVCRPNPAEQARSEAVATRYGASREDLRVRRARSGYVGGNKQSGFSYPGAEYGEEPRTAGRDAQRSWGKPDKPGITEDGMYRVADGTIFKVQWNRENTKLYAKRLRLVEMDLDGNIIAEHHTFSLDDKRREDRKYKAHFDYATGVVYKLQPEQRMTLAEAKRFGVLYGTCCDCGRNLTREASIASGIGPQCGADGRWRSDATIDVDL